ncbi:cytidylate kinase [Methylohalomonas lacus]|uniref:Cytidylate kinase n=1 Tax=Methylohalomonas lacus TaxID=398773 RepID=A0AAE3L3K8_9GAMM|nr:(d)CMP kinase [Methylohalomonas lacus]MCS3902288.1 cytidylate kinase [Methylohalomonas lacus]
MADESSNAPVIAIDGPSGTGKGTVCGRLAALLGWHLLDSGALYRLVALVAERSGTAGSDEAGLSRLAREMPLEFVKGEGETPIRALLDGEDVTAAIRAESISRLASEVAAHPGVRQALLIRQRAARRPPGLIADGRDMGTVVFPDAPVKLFLTAGPEERARRRYKQLKDKGIGVNLRQLSAELAERDARDSERAISPLKPATDAVVVDTTGIDIETVMQRVLAQVTENISDLPATVKSH